MISSQVETASDGVMQLIASFAGERRGFFDYSPVYWVCLHSMLVFDHTMEPPHIREERKLTVRFLDGGLTWSTNFLNASARESDPGPSTHSSTALRTWREVISAVHFVLLRERLETSSGILTVDMVL